MHGVSGIEQVLRQTRRNRPRPLRSVDLDYDLPLCRLQDEVDLLLLRARRECDRLLVPDAALREFLAEDVFLSAAFRLLQRTPLRGTPLRDP